MRSNRGVYRPTWSSSLRGPPLRSGIQDVSFLILLPSVALPPHGLFPAALCSQASESGSADDSQSQVLEWQEMVTEAVSARDRAKEEKVAMALRISHMEEEREGKSFC